ncbi:NADH-quinone oxidoreductase subunit K [compost metagenome]
MALCVILLVRVLAASEWGSLLLAQPLVFGLGHSLGLGAVLLAIGLYGAVTQRDGIRAWMSLEVSLVAAVLNLVAFGHFLHQQAGVGGLVLSIMGIGVAQALVGMVLLRALYVRRETVDLEAFDEVRG